MRATKAKAERLGYSLWTRTRNDLFPNFYQLEQIDPPYRYHLMTRNLHHIQNYLYYITRESNLDSNCAFSEFAKTTLRGLTFRNIRDFLDTFDLQIERGNGPIYFVTHEARLLVRTTRLAHILYTLDLFEGPGCYLHWWEYRTCNRRTKFKIVSIEQEYFNRK